MNRKFLAMLLALTMLLPALAACGKNPADETDPGTPDTGIQTPAEGESDAASELSDTVNLVTDGVSEYVIVRGENATDYEIKAASELQSYLKQISGAELAIVTDSTPAVEKEIIIGKTNREADGAYDRAALEDDGFIIKTEAGKLWLIGGERAGALFAVYEFLEAYLGCRFYTAEFEKVPEQKTITLEIAEDRQVPVFEIRQDYYYGVADTPLREKLKLRNPVWAGSFCHTLPGLSENGGNGASGPDPCLQSEEVFQTVLKNVRALLAANPGAEFISVSCHDGDNGCSCEKCIAYQKENGISANYIQFTNRIGEAIKDEYPDVMIHMFAYARSTEPPKSDIRVADNVMVQYCVGNACFSHPLTECDVQCNGDETGTLGTLDTDYYIKSWGEICDYLCIWDYTTCYEPLSMTLPNFDVLWQNMAFFADNNVRFVFSQGAHDWVTNGEFPELKGYLIGHLMWDPYMGEEKYYALMDEFLCDYYGPGWENIRAYIDYSDEVAESIHYNWKMRPEYLLNITVDESAADKPIPELSADTLRNYKDVDWTQYYTYFAPFTYNDIAEKGLEWFEAARQAAETEEQLFRINKSSIQVDLIQAYYIEYLYLRCAYPALGKIYEGNLKARVADGSMTQEEANALKAAFNKDIKTPVKDEGQQVFVDLANKMLAHGVTYLRMNSPVQKFLDGDERFWK